MTEEVNQSGLLAGHTVVVAGVGPGLGGHIARQAAAHGAAVVMGARSDRFGSELAAELAASGADAMFHACDVTSDDSCRSFIAAAIERFGSIDCIVANAMSGAGTGQTIEGGDVDAWQTAFDVNLFGSLRLAKAAIPYLKGRPNASVVFVSSQIVRRVFPGRGPYASSKAALITAAQVLAKEVGQYGVRVNTVVPGRMWGPSLQSAIPRLAAERGTTEQEQVQSWIDATALRRLATDEECARVVVFLASELAAAVTGQTIDANAGETMT